MKSLSKALSTAALILWAQPQHAHAYYSTVCDDCAFRFPATHSFQSDYIYESWDDALTACNEHCDASLPSCESITEGIESTVNATGAQCKFVDAAIRECVRQRGVIIETCKISCSVILRYRQPQYMVRTYWDLGLGNVWGNCQSWACSNCEYNLVACLNNKDCLYVLGDLMCFEPNQVIPVDEEKDTAIEGCWDLDCLLGSGADCFQEWAVCHHWCNLSGITSCDDARERCINTCVCDRYGWFFCPGPNNNGRRHLLERPPGEGPIPCANACDEEWESCIALGTDAPITSPPTSESTNADCSWFERMLGFCN